MNLNSLLAGGALVAVAVGAFAFRALRGHQRVTEAGKWPHVRGRILHAGMADVPRANGQTTREIVIHYEFDVDKRYKGTTPRASGDTFFDLREQVVFVQRFPPGAEIDVFYDPEDPTRNCLDRTDRSGVKWNLCIAGGLLGIGAVLEILLALR